MSLLRALQKPEESVKRPSGIDDTVLDGQSNNATRETLTEQDPETIAETVSAIASQLKQILYGNLPGKWSDVPAVSLAGILVQTQSQNMVVMNCLVSAQAGDLVFHSTIADNTVITCTSNVTPEPAFGWLVSKPTTTTCEVLYLGLVPTPLTRGNIFLGTDGKFSKLIPTTGYVQHLGISFGNGFMLFNPTLVRTKRAT